MATSDGGTLTRRGSPVSAGWGVGGSARENQGWGEVGQGDRRIETRASAGGVLGMHRHGAQARGLGLLTLVWGGGATREVRGRGIAQAKAGARGAAGTTTRGPAKDHHFDRRIVGENRGGKPSANALFAAAPAHVRRPHWETGGQKRAQTIA